MSVKPGIDWARAGLWPVYVGELFIGHVSPHFSSDEPVTFFQDCLDDRRFADIDEFINWLAAQWTLPREVRIDRE